MSRICIAGTHSGCGKTTVTCAVLSALTERGMKCASFKCGPDYIDPMFHRTVIGTKSGNLDSFFCGDETLKYLIGRIGADCDISVAEGVMGYYDGAGKSGSAFEICEKLSMPSVIVIDCKGMSESIGAVMKGFLTYCRPSRITGFIFNRLPPSLVGQVREICEKLGTEYLGCLPYSKDNSVESRRLGLVTANEIDDIKQRMKRLAALAEEHILLDRIIEIADAAPKLSDSFVPPEPLKEKCRIAVARDEAFCFLYSENIELLRSLGAETVFFSPIHDSAVPQADGMILCGGYPELHLEELSDNKAMLEDIRRKLSDGMPCIAECGGFMYLHEKIRLLSGESRSLVGAISGTAFETEKLQRFGYVTLTAQRENLLCGAAESFPAHEFHYFDSESCGDGFIAEKPNKSRSWFCGNAGASIYAGFPHLYFYAYPKIAEKFCAACAEYGRKNGQN